MDAAEVRTALEALCAHERRYARGETLLRAGDTTDSMGLVLEGSVTIKSDDVWGNRTILSHVGPGQFFAETYAFLKGAVLLVDVCANEDCRVLFFRLDALQTPPGQADLWRIRLLSNLLTISSRKNLILSGRSFHTSPKTIRGKVLAYLHSVSLQRHSGEFDLPFDRQQLADYLSVERTALSKELGKMRDAGLISFHRNHFVILSGDAHADLNRP